MRLRNLMMNTKELLSKLRIKIKQDIWKIFTMISEVQNIFMTEENV